MGLRESINEKPWLGWVMAGVILVGAIVMYMRMSGGSSDPFSADRATDMITIKFTDTGETMDVPQGRLIQQLIDRGKDVDPGKGFLNPKTGAFTGFPYDKKTWDGMVDYIKKVNTTESTVPISAEKKNKG